MIQRVVKIGEEIGIIIDNEILKSINADVNTVFELQIEARRIILEPLNPKRQIDEATFKKVQEKVMKDHHGTFKKLADSDGEL